MILKLLDCEKNCKRYSNIMVLKITVRLVAVLYSPEKDYLGTFRTRKIEKNVDFLKNRIRKIKKTRYSDGDFGGLDVVVLRMILATLLS